MFGSSSRSKPRKDPSWTQSPSSYGSIEPAWKDDGVKQSYVPTRQQTAAPSKSSSGKFWMSIILAIVGLLIVAFLLVSMVDVVQEQMMRNQPVAAPIPVGR
ncbi:metal homeostatis BSD2 family protein [Comamonas sp. Y33R10-2]|uniref:metal homeostatis BSD2 family protein n=1 Tax=Comamonas sp. Y33R10-2 TaxID=2853257 RepID=UPI001C5C9EC3|nr:metal homeostatis BSD2 family protein [Comamonas sp. Y33R10-2]QXZ09634.1 metal homeostatis BSD2 family protein [Comamonas sp. Y33R10-2]